MSKSWRHYATQGIVDRSVWSCRSRMQRIGTVRQGGNALRRQASNSHSHDGVSCAGVSYVSAISEVVVDEDETCYGRALNTMGEARLDIINCTFACKLLPQAGERCSLRTPCSYHVAVIQDSSALNASLGLGASVAERVLAHGGLDTVLTFDIVRDEGRGGWLLRRCRYGCRRRRGQHR